MRKVIFSLVIFFLFSIVSLEAQSPDFKDAVSAKVLFVDYHSIELGESAAYDQLTRGLEIGYTRNLSESFNLNIPTKIRFGTLPTGNGTFTSRKAIVGLDAILQMQFFKTKNILNPYFLAGLGGEYIEDQDANFCFPVGLGLNFKFMENLYIQGQAEYRVGFSDNTDNLLYGIGLMALIGEAAPPPPPDTDGDGITDMEDDCPLVAGLASLKGCPDADNDGIADKNDDCPDVAGTAAHKGCPDTDNDGIADKDDACPEVAGIRKFNGCPDTDNDGIIDGEDDCPNEAGPASNKGCPLPDMDGDGVLDKDDRCPNVAGTAANKGCPDTDQDGVVDIDDKCPKTAGPASNNGCPEIKKEDKEILEFAVQNVNFATGKATLLPASKSVLDQIVTIMQKYPDYSLRVEGHTDSVGNAESNQKLSEARAASCVTYIVSKGVAASRISSIGYGESKPIADNKYKAGRDENRRVEFDVYIK